MINYIICVNKQINIVLCWHMTNYINVWTNRSTSFCVDIWSILTRTSRSTSFCVRAMSSAAAKSQRQQLRMKATKRKTPELPSYVVEEHIDNLRAFMKLHKSKRGSPKMPAGKIRIFADCAGLSSETIALSLLGLTSEHMEFVGGSENDSAKRSMMQAVHKAFDLKTEKKLVEQDIFDRSLTETKSSDVYIAGFPCPAYSSCGRKLGAKGWAEARVAYLWRLEVHSLSETCTGHLRKCLRLFEQAPCPDTQSDEEVLCQRLGTRSTSRSFLPKSMEFLKVEAAVIWLPFVATKGRKCPSSFRLAC